MLRVGLTGGIGSGKSTVGRVFAALNVPVYHADERAKILMNCDDSLISRIRESFGEKSYESGRLNNRYLASVVFPDENKLQRLNSIVHPAVEKDIEAWYAIMKGEGNPYVIIEVAILFESGFDRLTDRIVTVSAPEEVRVERIVRRDGTAVQAVKERINRQMGDREREERSDFVILNDGHTMVIPQVLELHEKLGRVCITP